LMRGKRSQVAVAGVELTALPYTTRQTSPYLRSATCGFVNPTQNSIVTIV
jgi:hypothetical protein